MSDWAVVLTCMVPSAIIGWVALSAQSKIQAENRTLLAAVLALSDKPAAVMHAARMEASAVDQVGFPRPPLRRPHAGAG